MQKTTDYGKSWTSLATSDLRGYALVLEDTSENGAIWTVERIRRHMTASAPGLIMWAGVACYPAHGFTTDEILAAAARYRDLVPDRQGGSFIASPPSPTPVPGTARPRASPYRCP